MRRTGQAGFPCKPPELAARGGWHSSRWAFERAGPLGSLKASGSTAAVLESPGPGLGKTLEALGEEAELGLDCGRRTELAPVNSLTVT